MVVFGIPAQILNKLFIMSNYHQLKRVALLSALNQFTNLFSQIKGILIIEVGGRLVKRQDATVYSESFG